MLNNFLEHLKQLNLKEHVCNLDDKYQDVVLFLPSNNFYRSINDMLAKLAKEFSITEKVFNFNYFHFNYIYLFIVWYNFFIFYFNFLI